MLVEEWVVEWEVVQVEEWVVEWEVVQVEGLGVVSVKELEEVGDLGAAVAEDMEVVLGEALVEVLAREVVEAQVWGVG